MQRPARCLCVCLIGLSLGACSLASPRPLPDVPAGTLLIQHRDLTLPADTTRLYLQHGRVLTARQLTVWEQHCAVVIERAAEVPVTLPAGTHVVAATQRTSSIGEWGRGVITYENRLLIDAQSRPLYALDCELWTLGEVYTPRYHIDREGLRKTLGEVFELRPAP